MNHRTTQRRTLAGGAIVFAAALALTGCADSEASDSAKKPEIEVSGAYIPAPTMADMAAGFFTLTNKGGADKLTSATSDLAESVTLHSTEGGTMKERRSFDVPADGHLDFASGGNHLMLEKLRHKPKKGEKVTLTLRFAKSDPIKVEVPVEAATYQPPRHDTSHDSH